MVLSSYLEQWDWRMGRNYWMFVQTLANFEASKRLGFTLHGLGSRQRRRAQRMEPDDRVLYYVSGLRKWAASASIKSRYFEDSKPIWTLDRRPEVFPYRVKLSPGIVLDEADYIDALLLAPRLEYLKRWLPERWPLAFLETLHLLPQRDFRLIEGEMRRIVSRRRRRRGRGRLAERSDAAHPLEDNGPQGKAAESSAAGRSGMAALEVGGSGDEMRAPAEEATAAEDGTVEDALGGDAVGSRPGDASEGETQTSCTEGSPAGAD